MVQLQLRLLLVACMVLSLEEVGGLTIPFHCQQDDQQDQCQLGEPCRQRDPRQHCDQCLRLHDDVFPRGEVADSTCQSLLSEDYFSGAASVASHIEFCGRCALGLRAQPVMMMQVEECHKGSQRISYGFLMKFTNKASRLKKFTRHCDRRSSKDLSKDLSSSEEAFKTRITRI
jgi:hypothetical protein